ncbi:S41 family peptidase [Pedobacter sp. Hv1]|uniref:S41 family peptidase n=1 Tax=Pedobacter sp. Hv1 TaxID=1740090 RepID=UPI0006D88A33|nr:S41 family peptidase [Pedobacter sp. Hv1]KQC01721.1 peptidase S41 protein [Pedobacter sp. Hv1]
MKRTLGILLIVSLALHLPAQEKLTAQDSIKVFYDQLFSALKIGYLHKQTVNWKLVEAETKQRLAAYRNFKNSLDEIKPLFDKIGATHCTVFDQQNRYTSTAKIISKEDYSTQWQKKYDTKPGFEAKVLNGKYGYILMPRMLFFDTSAANIHQIAQPLYDQIADIKTKHQIEGWMIDLRFNTGGNSTPMLLALYDFLGDNEVWGSLNLNKKTERSAKLKKGKYIDRSKTEPFINPSGALLDQAKVAVITGIFTASAGEVTALAFKGRPHTIFIGESTYGATTGNVMWPLPFEMTMALTTSYDSDRNGNYHEKIIPDITILKQDNYDELLLDQKIQEAIKWITNKS